MSICVNHTSRSATARCSSCHKPICNDCILKDRSEVYCSERCAENAARFQSRNTPDSGPGIVIKLKTFIISLIKLVIVIVLIAAMLAYVLKIPFFADLMKNLGM